MTPFAIAVVAFAVMTGLFVFACVRWEQAIRRERAAAARYRAAVLRQLDAQSREHQSMRVPS